MKANGIETNSIGKMKKAAATNALENRFIELTESACDISRSGQELEMANTSIESGPNRCPLISKQQIQDNIIANPSKTIELLSQIRF